MGILEINNKRNVRKRALRYAVLATIKSAGVISIAVLAPNVLVALGKLGIMSKPRQNEYISSSAARLVKKGLLVFKDGRYQLTPEGEKILYRWELGNQVLNKPKKWDKKWRVIIFDIPEKKRGVRRQISYLFAQAGMYRLQDSVWVYPYDCEDVIGVLKTDFGVGKNILYLIVDELENDKHLRKEFGIL